MRKMAIIAAILAAVCAAPLLADVKFTRLAENQFIVHHRKHSLLGAEAKATRTAYKEAASVCLAAGYSHMEIKDQNIGERQHGGWFGGGRGASADLKIKLYQDPTEEQIDEKDLIECEGLSDPEKVKVAKRKLAKEE